MREDGQKYIDSLKELKELQEKLCKDNEGKPYCKAVSFAEHYIRHFFGMETDNYLLDLYYEIDHLCYMKDHISEHDNSEESFELRIRLKDYQNALIKYHEIKLKEAIRGNDKS